MADGKRPARYSVGDRVLARWKGGDFYPGAVTAVNADGSYVIQFDDGDLESAEPHAHMVRRAPARHRPSHPRSLVRRARPVFLLPDEARPALLCGRAFDRCSAAARLTVALRPRV